MKAKYLFLDFDGVLHSSLCADNDRFSKVNLLSQAFISSPCQIIISSSWRFQFTLDQMKKMLPVNISNLIIDVTGDAITAEYARYFEIKQWRKFAVKSIFNVIKKIALYLKLHIL